MNLFEEHGDIDLLRSLLAEAAKELNELNCAKADIDKAISRNRFIIVLVNKLIERQQGD